MQPPRLAAIARGKLSNRPCFKFRRVRTNPMALRPFSFSRRNVPARRVCLPAHVGRSMPVSSALRQREVLPSRENSDIDPSLSVLLRIPNRQKLGRLANALTAADLRVHPVSKAALVSRSGALRAVKEIHYERFPAIHLIPGVQLFFPSVAAVPPRVGKQVFESPRGIARVTRINAVAKIFIKYLPGLQRPRLFEALGVAMGVSDYLFDVFRDCF